MTSDIGAGEAALGATSAVDDGLVAGGEKPAGEGGLLQQSTKHVLESALEGEPLDRERPGRRVPVLRLRPRPGTTRW
ncbi:hypothetical protein U5640_31565 [Streptomyces sp. SS7]|uniref:hypothetical protein n=1 Tax=Streptomyces sp. SS7 TaxID=3108485 RepID=UPI0030ED11EB